MWMYYKDGMECLLQNILDTDVIQVIVRGGFHIILYAYVILKIFILWGCIFVLQAMIFVADVGSNLAIGILPHAKELLQRGAKVWVLFITMFFFFSFFLHIIVLMHDSLWSLWNCTSIHPLTLMSIIQFWVSI